MDKYHIYEEVGAGKHSQVFKGREKMDIEYVAIKRVEKSMMDQVVKEVQVIHRLRSPNVLKFYDWYETRNNVWLILEFCTGGDLLTLIKQDHREPESAVRLFGVDLLAGLQQTHACGYLHGDLRPSNILIDEYGILKLSGFGRARGIPEIGEGDRTGGDDGLYSQQQQRLKKHSPSGGRDGSEGGVGLRLEGRDPTYMAPELFLGEDAVSFASDFWSLGCVLFELLTGEPPFRASPAVPVSERIGRENPPGLDKGEWQGAHMSPDFCGLVSWLLQKDPLYRPTWPHLLAHPFWGNCQTPSPLEMPAQPLFDQALAAAAMAKEEKAASVAPKETQAATQSENLDNLDYSSERGGEGLAATTATVGAHRRRDGGGRDSRSPRVGVPGGAEESHQEEEDNGEESYRMGHPRNRRDRGEGRDEEARVTLDRLRRTAATTGRASRTVGESVGGARGGDREREGSAVPPRGDPLTTRAVDFRNGQRQERQNERLEYLAEDTAASGNRSNQVSDTERGKDPAPAPAPLVPPAVERRKAPHHGSCVNVGDENSFGSVMRGVGGGDDTAKRKEAAAAAAALNGLRLRGRIPPVRGGRTSPSEVSAASASSSLEERYGSSFEEDMEGSSSCSAVGGSGSSEAATGGGAAAMATAGLGKNICSGGRVMTPGSVGTATTATPSTGCASASSTRGGRGSSCGSGVDRNCVGAVTGQQGVSAGARLTPPAAPGTPGDGGEHWRRQTSSGSTASTFGSGSDSRLDCPVPGSESLGSGPGDVAMTHRLLTTTLRFGRTATAVESPCSERVSTSSWTQSSGDSTSPASRGTLGGEWGSTGASPPGMWGGGQGQEGRQAAVHGRPSAWVARADAAVDSKGRSGPEGTTKTRVLEKRVINAHSGDGGTGGAQGEDSPALGIVEGRVQGADNSSVCFVGRGKPTEAVVVGVNGGGITGNARRHGLRELLLHTSDAQVTPIVGNRSEDLANPAHARGGRPSRDQLPFEALLPETVFAMLPPDLEAHLTVVYNALTEASASVRQRGQTLLYLQSLAPVPRVANLLINSTFLVLLLRLLRKPRPAAIRDTVATLVGLLVRHATYIAPGAGKVPPVNNQSVDGGTADEDGGMRGRVESTNGGGLSAGGGGLLSALIAVIRERPAPGRAAQAAALRRNAMAALGELLFYVVTQESDTPATVGAGGDHGVGTSGGADDGGSKAWDIPVAAIGAAISKCLEDVDYEGVQQHAAKTLENVLAQAGPSHALVQALVTPHLALCLLDLMRHASSESLRGNAVAGLSHLLGHDILGGECGATSSIGRADDVSNGEFRQRGKGDSAIVASVRREDGQCGRRYAVEETRAISGWVASRVMCEPCAPLVVVNGLSEGSSPASRRAFFNVLNLVLWGRRNGVGSGGGGGSSGGKQGGPPRKAIDDQADQHRGFSSGAGGEPDFHHAVRRASETMLDSQHLLPRLLRAAEHGEGTILRAKGFLALRLALEVAPPALLLKACRSRLLPLLARAIGALAPRATTAADAAVPALSPQQEYLYECCTTLADWLCTIPEKAARRLAAELRRQGAGGSAAGGGGGGGGHNQRSNNSGSRRVIRQPSGVDARTSLEAAMAAFPAVVHLVNSPLLRGRAVTGAFVSSVSVCLGLCCPVFTERGDITAGEAVSSAAACVVDKDGGTGGALSALLPTVETLAQQAEAALLPHWETVSEELIPVLCRLLRSPSGDTRALTVAVFRVLLPPLLRPAVPSQQHNFLDRVPTTPSCTVDAAVAVGSPVRVRSAIAVHLLPLAAALLRDHTPIPQYTVRLLADVGREWGGLGGALLAQQDAIPALLDRLPCPLPMSSSPTPPPDSISTKFPWPATGSSPRGTRVPGTQHPESEPGYSSPALDLALAALLTLLVERDDGGGGAGAGGGLEDDGYFGSSDDRSDDEHVGDDLCVALLRLKLPGRVAAAVAGAVAAGMPETAEAFLGLAVALLGATAGRHGRRAGESTPAGGRTGRWGLQGSMKYLLEPLLCAVPAAAEGLQLFCGRGGWIDRREQQLAGTRRDMFIENGVRTGVSESATDFLDLCHQLFDDHLLRALLLLPPRATASSGSALPTATPTPAPSRACRHLADFLGSYDEDERPRLRILRVLLAAAAASDSGLPYRSAVGQGPLWTALLRLATGRAGGADGGRAGRFQGEAAREGSRVGFGPMHALAREIVAAVREDRGYGGAEPRKRSGRVGGGR